MFRDELSRRWLALGLVNGGIFRSFLDGSGQLAPAMADL